jgi:hypothetical protein
MTSTEATRTGRKVTVNRDGQEFTLATSKPFLIVWDRCGVLKASAAVSRRAAETGVKQVAKNSGDSNIEIVEVPAS